MGSSPIDGCPLAPSGQPPCFSSIALAGPAGLAPVPFRGPMSESPVSEQPCPVPEAQQPLSLYRELVESWFFSWPYRGEASLGRFLLASWLGVLPISLLVASGSVPLRHDLPRLAAAAAVAALVVPLLLLVRQWLGWTTVLQRLLAERVEYEESGWYDGQVWEKPLAWREQDWLVASHQVRPILARLQRALAFAALLLLGGASLCQAL